LEEIEKPWKLKLKSSSVNSRLENLPANPELPVWQNVNIGWLANPKAFQPHCLPKMKIPDSETGGVYNSPEEYFEV